MKRYWISILVFVEQFSIHYVIAINLSTGVTYFYSYFINKTFVFFDFDGGHLLKGSKFLLLQLSLIVSTNIIVFICVSVLHLHYMLVIISMSVINAAISFLVMRSSIFLQSQSAVRQ